MSSEESFEELNLVDVGIVLHCSEEGSKEDGHQFFCSWGLQRARRVMVGTIENVHQ